MNKTNNKEHHQSDDALKKGTISAGAIAVIVVTAASITVLLWMYGGNPQVSLKAIDTAARFGLGAGGGIALLLAALRHRATQQDLLHRERVAKETKEREEYANKATENDARERRVSELSTSAIEQLGHEKSAVRLGALYSLQRLAGNYQEIRQSILNIVCAYIRMSTDQEEDVGEKEVKRSALDVVRNVVDQAPHSEFLSVNLNGAHITEDFVLRGKCQIKAEFSFAVFHGRATFEGVRFIQSLAFEKTEFKDKLKFNDCSGSLEFAYANFRDQVEFIGSNAKEGNKNKKIEYGSIGFAHSVFWCDVILLGISATRVSFIEPQVINDAGLLDSRNDISFREGFDRFSEAEVEFRTNHLGRVYILERRYR